MSEETFDFQMLVGARLVDSGYCYNYGSEEGRAPEYVVKLGFDNSVKITVKHSLPSTVHINVPKDSLVKNAARNSDGSVGLELEYNHEDDKSVIYQITLFDADIFWPINNWEEIKQRTEEDVHHPAQELECGGGGELPPQSWM